MKRFFFWFLGVLFLVFLIARGVPFLINQYLNHNADRIVTSMITRTSSFGNHEVSFGDIRLDYDYFGTYLKISNISVRPSRLIDEKAVKVNLKADQVDITGFQWYTFLFKNTISVDSAKLENIKIISSSPPFDSLHFEPKEKKRTAGKDYDLIEVKFFDLKDFSVELRDNIHDSLKAELVDMNLRAMDFQLTKEDIQNSQSLFQVGLVQGKIHKVAFHFDQFRQYVEVSDIELDTESKSMAFGHMGLLNKVPKYEYTSKFEERQSYVKIDEAKLKLQGVNFEQYLRNGIIEVDSIYVDNLQLELFVDKRKPENLNKRPQMLHHVFQNLQQVIHIDHVVLANSHILIEERPDNLSPRSATLFFSEVGASIRNISNYPERRMDNHLLDVDLTAKLMGQGSLQSTIRYDLDDASGNFWLRGTLGKLDLRLLNTMLEPEAKASLKSGVVNRLDFNIAGNDQEGTGELIIRYDNLELELLNKDFEKDQNIFRKIGAFLANKIIIKSSNPNSKGDLKKGQVFFRREVHKSVFNYWWKLIFSGLKSTVTGEDIDAMRKKDLEKKSEAVLPTQNKAQSQRREEKVKTASVSKEKRGAGEEEKNENKRNFVRI